MDGVIVDFQSGIDALSMAQRLDFKDKYQRCPGIFSLMKPYPGSIEAMKKMFDVYDLYILSSPGWYNSTAWSDKHAWVVKYLPFMERRLILSSQKHLNMGDYLIDDRTANGAVEFKGEFVHFGTKEFPHWDGVLSYFGVN